MMQCIPHCCISFLCVQLYTSVSVILICTAARGVEVQIRVYTITDKGHLTPPPLGRGVGNKINMIRKSRLFLSGLDGTKAFLALLNFLQNFLFLNHF